MYSQFFGNYLLGRQVVTTEQLIQAIEEQHIRHLKVGTLAIHAGYMTTEQVDDVLMLQAHENKRFGEIAVEKGYLTKEQVQSLLNEQIPIYLLIGQRLVENGALTDSQLKELILSYQKENELSKLVDDSAQQENLQTLIRNLFLITITDIPDYLMQYLALLFNNLIRLIGEDFLPLNPVFCKEYVTNHCSAQIIDGEFPLTSYFDFEEDTAIAFASRYANEEFREYDAYVRSAMEDFLNIHNGLFCVNASNEKSVELVLNPPTIFDNAMISYTSNILHLPIIYPFGTLNILIKL